MIIIIYLLAALAAGVAIDIVFGDPRNRYHPVSWLGRLIIFFVPLLKTGPAHTGETVVGAGDTHSLSNKTLTRRSIARQEKAKGAVFATLLVALAALAIYCIQAAILLFLGLAAMVVFSALVLKITIAIRGMERHALAVANSLAEGNLAKARQDLSMIVRRDTGNLDEQHIISATIECIGESTVDGIVSPLFYYSLFGPAGAVGCRVINTLDSMVAYKDDYYCNIGWMSARMDTLANYVPARITACLMVVCSKIIGADWRNSMQVLKRDRAKTSSPNAGYPMAAMAGALRIKLEKIGYYSLGDEQEPNSISKCRTALSIMKLTTILFCLFFSAPLMTVLYLAGWWNLLFGI